MGKKKKIGLGMAALAASAGVAAVAVKNYKKTEKDPAIDAAKEEYRNTERGKNDEKMFFSKNVLFKR